MIFYDNTVGRGELMTGTTAKTSNKYYWSRWSINGKVAVHTICSELGTKTWAAFQRGQ